MSRSSIVLVLIGIALLGGLLWSRTSAPCDAFANMPITDVPSRCITEVVK